MKGKCLYILMGMSLMLASCHEEEVVQTDLRVMLNAGVQEMVQQGSRSVDGVDVHKGTSVANMKAVVWFSDEDGVYPESNPASPTFLPYRANLTYEEGATIVYTNPTALEDPVSYVVEGDEKVYCVGLYPQTGWTAVTNDAGRTVATHAVDGKQDLMFASQLSGSLDNKLGKQNYRHLLSWLKFTICATDSEAAEDWGKVNSVKLVDAKGNVSITLGTGEVNYSSSTETDNDMEVLDEAFELATSIKDIGSSLCMPAEKCQLQITTEKGSVKTLDLSFDSEGFKAGYFYLVKLYFKPHNDVNAVCSLVPMNEENVEL